MFRTLANLSVKAHALALAAALGCTACSSADDSSAPSGAGASQGTGNHGGSQDAGGAGAGGDGLGGNAATGGAPVDFCGSCGPVSTQGGLANAAITEASGIAASALHADRFYLQNDSGDSARFFAIDATGADFGTFKVTGAKATDWEDLAVGPCEATSCVYLADIGDNKESRASYAIYRVVEPSALVAGQHSLAAEAFPFTYPDGSHNAETLLVHPVTGVLTIVTKTAHPPSTIYEFPMPLSPGVSVELIKRGEVMPIGKSPLFTGGDANARGVLLRTYESVMYFPMSATQSVSDALLGVPCSAPAPLEPKGEAVGWFADGSGYATVSEGAASPVSLVSCPH